MHLSPGARVFRFGVFELDTDSGELRRHGLKVRLPDQSFHILRALLLHPGEVVTREDLQKILWPGETFVDFEVGLNSAVRKLREALDDSAENPRFIETMPRRGYRFVATVMSPVEAPTPAPAPSEPPSAEQALVSLPEVVSGRPAEHVSLPSTMARPSRVRWSAIALLLVLLIGLAGFAYKTGLLTPRGKPAPVFTRVIAPNAQDAFAKGLTARGLGRHEGFRRAVEYFEEAIAIEPGFAEAYAELAQVQVQFLFGGPYSPHQVIPKAEAAARKALQLDDSLSLAHRALGQILNLYYWRWEEGDKELERASILGGLDDPPEAFSGSLRRRGRYQEAIAAAERGRKYDPLSVQAHLAVANSYRAAGDYARAESEYSRVIQMSPGNNRVQFQIGVNFVAMGRYPEAIRELEVAARQATGHNSRMEAYLGYAYAAAGRARDAREVLKELDAHRKDQYVSWFGIALIHDALGEKTPALEALQRAFEDRAVEFGLHDNYAQFRTIASEPAYLAVIRQVGR